MLEKIILQEFTYGWVSCLKWDNNYCHPDFSTCCERKEDALNTMMFKIAVDGRVNLNKVKSLPVVEIPLVI